MGLAIGLAVAIVWVAVTVLYLVHLRRTLALREQSLVSDVARAAAELRDWEDAYAAASRRDWRDSVEALERSLQAMTGEVAIPVRVQAARELHRILDGELARVAQDPMAFPPGVEARAQSLAATLGEMETHIAAYNAAVRAATFACERFPLSAFAGVLGLSPPQMVR